MISFRPRTQEEGERVDVVIARRSGWPRAAVQAALRSGEITVNGASCKPSHRLESGDEIAGDVTVRHDAPPEGEAIELAIRYDDDRVVVVSKPAGLVTHPAGGHPSGTLVNALVGSGIPLSGRGTDRPGIVHRLDKDTSGLLLVAKDDDAHLHLVGALKQRLIERRYLAVVRGVMGADSGTIEAPIARHPTRRRSMAVVPDGRPAVTHYRVLDSSDAGTLLDVSLETGRTHQIRVHLSYIGHPVLGDRTYGGASEASIALGLTRPFLHAYKLTFPHPDDGRAVTVEDDLPSELQAVLRTAGLAR